MPVEFQFQTLYGVLVSRIKKKTLMLPCIWQPSEFRDLGLNHKKSISRFNKHVDGRIGDRCLHILSALLYMSLQLR